MRRNEISRRLAIASVGTTALSAAVRPGPGHAQDAPPPVIIGVLTDQSGIGASVSGPPLVEAVRMAVDDTAELPYGRAVSVVTGSYRLKPDEAVAIARRWFEQGVSVIVDVPGSAAALAVQGLARSMGRSVLFTGCVEPALTSAACSPFGSSWGLDSASIATTLVAALGRTGAKSWFLVTPDTVLGLAMQADAIRAIEAAGGQVAGRSRHPLEETDFGSVVDQAKRSGARAVGLCDISQGLSDQLGQFRSGGLFGDGRSVAAFLPSIADIHAAGAAAAQGLILAAPFYWHQNDQARSFAARFMTSAGRMPDAAHAAAYVAVRHYLRAVVTTEGLDARLINQDMRRTPVYFFGRSGRLRLDGRLAVDLSLLRVKPPAAMEGEWDHYEQTSVIPAADIYRPLSQTGCRWEI